MVSRRPNTQLRPGAMLHVALLLISRTMPIPAILFLSIHMALIRSLGTCCLLEGSGPTLLQGILNCMNTFIEHRSSNRTNAYVTLWSGTFTTTAASSLVEMSYNGHWYSSGELILCSRSARVKVYFFKQLRNNTTNTSHIHTFKK